MFVVDKSKGYYGKILGIDFYKGWYGGLYGEKDGKEVGISSAEFFCNANGVKGLEDIVLYQLAKTKRLIEIGIYKEK